MKKSYIIGVDVSKLTLDVHCHGQAECLLTANNIKGYKSLLKWLKQQVSKQLSEVIIVMEYAGCTRTSWRSFYTSSRLIM